ncbi:pseudouridine synthase [Cytidiella melzeri]|nr:pseudouridine synthase [Cytidiella melzeri]
MSHKYEDWPKERLVAHLLKLENTLKNARPGLNALLSASSVETHPSSEVTAPVRAQRTFKFSDHPTRKIALKFTYDGTHYNGLEHQKDVTPLPTVEETLWHALARTRLVDREGDFDSHGWEKCGRTDRGVSAAGQVVSFWVRSKQEGHPQREQAVPADAPSRLSPTSARHPAFDREGATAMYDSTDNMFDESLAAMSGWDEAASNNTLPIPPTTGSSSSDNPQEFDYVSLLNGVLPPTLRVISWSPIDPSFSARFNCRGRHYKYFFVSRGLNIDAMQEGARRLVGDHDWRNLCKVDPAKFRLDAEGEDRWSFRRIVKSAEINSVHSHTRSSTLVQRSDEDQGELYVFDLIGTAFLYNQVRHIMAILFLIGSGLEQPSVITALLNVNTSNPYPPYKSDEPIPPIVLGKPTYQMADALPLVLWDCQYDKDDVNWIGDIDSCLPHGERFAQQKSDVNGLYAELRSMHERSWVHSALHEHFLKAASRYHRPPKELLPFSPSKSGVHARPIPNGTVLGIPLGGGTQRNTRYAGGKGYVSLLERKRSDEVEDIWERWKNGRGSKNRKKETSTAGLEG